MSEETFHLSVIKWLSDRQYKFWWEVSLPNSRLRPDFLAYASDGEKMVIECKINRIRAYLAMEMLPSYMELLGDSSIHAYLVVPNDLYLPLRFVRRFETFYKHILRIPVDPISDFAQCNALPVEELHKYFSAYINAPGISRTSDSERFARIMGKEAA